MAKKEVQKSTIEKLYEDPSQMKDHNWFTNLHEHVYRIKKIEKVENKIYRVHLDAEQKLYPTYAPDHPCFGKSSDLKDTVTKEKELKEEREDRKAIEELPKRKRAEAKEPKTKSAPKPTNIDADEIDDILGED